MDVQTGPYDFGHPGLFQAEGSPLPASVAYFVGHAVPISSPAGDSLHGSVLAGRAHHLDNLHKLVDPQLPRELWLSQHLLGRVTASELHLSIIRERSPLCHGWVQLASEAIRRW